MSIASLIFLCCLLACAVAAAPAFARLARQLARTAGEVGRLGQTLDEQFLPRVERLLGQTSEAVRDLESMSASFQEVGRHAQESISPLGDVTVEAEAALAPFARSAAALGLSRARARALGSGLQSAWKAWKTR